MSRLRMFQRGVVACAVTAMLVTGGAAGALAQPPEPREPRPGSQEWYEQEGYTPALAWLMERFGGKSTGVDASLHAAATNVAASSLTDVKQAAAWRIVAPMLLEIGTTVVVTWSDGSKTSFKQVCKSGTVCMKIIRDTPAPEPAQPAPTEEPAARGGDGGGREGGFRDGGFERSNERWLADWMRDNPSRTGIVTVRIL